MATNLLQILDRLLEENLGTHGYSDTALRRHSYSPMLSNELNEAEPASKDLRWLDLFVEFFLENSDALNDDLLFFVRQQKANNRELDPVFVKRKLPPPSPMPQLEDIVQWEETFFLNLIVQLPCMLTVAVCKRNTDASIVPGLKTSMTCTWKHVSKRVYALPSKSRMDTKGSDWECSYPLIYYVVEDYDHMFEHLVVREGEYLCVELAVNLSNGKDQSLDESSNEDNQFEDQVYSDKKIVLFQGAASYSALLDLYRQKAANKLKNRFTLGPSLPPTEYIMMRGPGSKGHAQVAITASVREEKESNGTRSYPSSLILQSDSKDLSPFSPANIIRSIKRLSSASSLEKQLQKPVDLKCCMTFVNVPWRGIISDLTVYARKEKTFIS